MKISSCITSISSSGDQLFHDSHFESVSRDVKVILLCITLFPPVSFSLEAMSGCTEQSEFVEPLEAFEVPLSPEMCGIFPYESENQHYVENFGYRDDVSDAPREVFSKEQGGTPSAGNSV